MHTCPWIFHVHKRRRTFGSCPLQATRHHITLMWSKPWQSKNATTRKGLWGGIAGARLVACWKIPGKVGRHLPAFFTRPKRGGPLFSWEHNLAKSRRLLHNNNQPGTWSKTTANCQDKFVTRKICIYDSPRLVCLHAHAHTTLDVGKHNQISDFKTRLIFFFWRKKKASCKTLDIRA